MGVVAVLSRLDTAQADGGVTASVLTVSDRPRIAHDLFHPDIDRAYRSFCGWRTIMESARLDPVFRFSSTTGRLAGSLPVGQASTS